jgi:acyl-CoA hydrolase
MPSFVHDVARPDVAVVTGVRRGSDLVFGSTVGYGPAAARAATAVVVEVDEEGADFGGPPIPGNIVATIPRPVVPEPLSPPREPDAIELAIAHNVVALLPDNATLQYGPGGIAEAIIASLERPVRIWSGLATDAVAELDRRGLLVAPAVAAYVWGTQAMADLAACGRLELRPVEDTHDVSRLAAIERFVGCNTALQVGLDGAVNVERVGGRVVAGIGGHADFCAGAARSHGGLAIVALRSQTRSGVSTIVPHVDVVSTPRCDVDVVVTEHGVADLRGIDDAERARRLVRIAAPEHRATLEAAIG